LSQHKLGIAYSRGLLGLDQSDADAVRWWNAAVDQGLADAKVSLGIAYYTGRTGEEESSSSRMLSEEKMADNYDKALHLWQEAAAKGCCEAKTNLACMYLEGRGVTRSSKTAIKLLNQASTEGVGDIQVIFCFLRCFRLEYRMGVDEV
jgi:uncharacterized protein